MRYSVEPSDMIYDKGYQVLSLKSKWKNDVAVSTHKKFLTPQKVKTASKRVTQRNSRSNT